MPEGTPVRRKREDEKRIVRFFSAAKRAVSAFFRDFWEFLKNVWDFEKSPNEFVFKGKTAAIVDFYADWCGPCRKVGPIMEKLAQEYDGRLTVYKVNVDKERDLAAIFQVRSIPTVLFIPVGGQPLMQVGAMSEADYRKVIEEKLMK